MWREISLTVCTLGLLVMPGCNNQSPNSPTSLPVTVEDKGQDIDTSVGDKDNDFPVKDTDTVQEQIEEKTLLDPNSEEGRQWLIDFGLLSPASPVTHAGALTLEAWDMPEGSLIVGIPKELIGQQMLFGGVITGVSDRTSSRLGGLKMSEVNPSHIRPVVTPGPEGHYKLELLGCLAECTESSPEEGVFAFPVVAIDTSAGAALIDLSAVADRLNIITRRDPNGEYIKLKEKSSRASLFDFSKGTLVFDIESLMSPILEEGDETEVDDVLITSRWYLKMGSNFNPYFVAREHRDEVGFFGVQRNDQNWITRFPMNHRTDQAPIHYYIKNVPMQWQAAFAGALDEWNQTFQQAIDQDRPMVTYEFVAPDSPLQNLIVAGDPRYNVVEWDLKNVASYGGLGPSIASQATGEIFSATSLIQGPLIIDLYSEWFGINQVARNQRAAGDLRGADLTIRDGRRMIREQLAHHAGEYKIEAKIGQLALEIPSMDPQLRDPLMARLEFKEVPFYESFESYMNGYFHEIVAHEVGHNLGLTHNFKGSLGSEAASDEDISDPESTVKSISYSIMEYVIRPHRYKNRVGEYDRMAIAYGYFGRIPERSDIFCHDGQQASVWNPEGNAECSNKDGGHNPIKYFRKLVKRSLDLVVDVDHRMGPPLWTIDDVASEFMDGVDGLSNYATTAEIHFSNWTNFSLVPGRPQQAEDVPSYMTELLDKILCAPYYDRAVEIKEEQEWRDLARANLVELRQLASQRAQELGLEFGVCLD